MSVETPAVHAPVEHTNFRSDNGFTLLELLIVVATISILAALLLPVAGKAPKQARAIKCLNNTKQLTLGWILFAADNRDICRMLNWAGGVMDWSSGMNNVDTAPLLTNQMGDYVPSVTVYKCPEDHFQSGQNPGPRVRTISMNGQFATEFGPEAKGDGPDQARRYFARGVHGTGRGVIRMSELSATSPANVFVILDEHPDSVNDAIFQHDPGWRPGSERWRDLPASHHNGAGSFSFADGHSELHKWQETSGIKKTTYSVIYQSWSIRPEKGLNMGISRDYEWLQDRMAYTTK